MIPVREVIYTLCMALADVGHWHCILKSKLRSVRMVSAKNAWSCTCMYAFALIEQAVLCLPKCKTTVI